MPATLARKLKLHDYFALAFGTMIGTNQSYRRYQDLIQHARSASQIAAQYETDLVFGTGEAAHEERTGLVSASFWPLFGVQPALGRFFTSTEDQLPQGTPVAVLGYGYWQSHFGGALDVLGKAELQLRVGDPELALVGVAQVASGLQVLDRDAELPGEHAESLDGRRARAGLDPGDVRVRHAGRCELALREAALEPQTAQAFANRLRSSLRSVQGPGAHLHRSPGCRQRQQTLLLTTNDDLSPLVHGP